MRWSRAQNVWISSESKVATDFIPVRRGWVVFSPGIFFDVAGTRRNCLATGAWALFQVGPPATCAGPGPPRHGPHAPGFKWCLTVSSCRMTRRYFSWDLGFATLGPVGFSCFNYVFPVVEQTGDPMCVTCGWVSGVFSLLDFAYGARQIWTMGRLLELYEARIWRAKEFHANCFFSPQYLFVAIIWLCSWPTTDLGEPWK